jgi:hypothetical protein
LGGIHHDVQTAVLEPLDQLRCDLQMVSSACNGQVGDWREASWCKGHVQTLSKAKSDAWLNFGLAPETIGVSVG